MIQSVILTKGQKYYRNHREEELERSRKIRETSERIRYMADYEINNRVHLNKIKSTWLQNNPDHKEWRKNWSHQDHIRKSKNPEWMAQQSKRASQWGKDNPEKKLLKDIRHLKKLGIVFNIKYFQVGMTLKSWSQTVKQNFISCKICGDNATQSHHLFHIQYYPKLAFNINNGIPLCDIHHKEVHGHKLRG